MRKSLTPMLTVIAPALLLAAICAVFTSHDMAAAPPSAWPPVPHAAVTATTYLPVVSGGSGLSPVGRVNAPYFSDSIRYSETAIFWFGQVHQASNYADVRVGYNSRELYVHLLIFDRRLWYDPSHSPASLTAWDATSLYVRLEGNSGSAPDAGTYRFDAQFSDGETLRTPWQASYRGSNSGWAPLPLSFTTQSGYRWESGTVGGINNNQNNRGWTLTYHIPFSSLGLAAPPAQGTIWGLGLVLHDRDDEAGTPITDQKWPRELNAGRPDTWGQLHFGLPTYTAPTTDDRHAIAIRQGLNGAVVPDAAVGGTTGNLCPGDPDYLWGTGPVTASWGDASFPSAADFNLQNQADVADWPCFAKYYVTFPLAAVPPGRRIVSATLTLHEWGGSDPNLAQPSLIQVLTVADDWDPAALTWNNAPLALENVSRTWVDPIPPPGFAGWPGKPVTWDVSRAVARAYAANQPLRLALYEADSAYHSGKYFTTSDIEDWDAVGRPTLLVTFGSP